MQPSRWTSLALFGRGGNRGRERPEIRLAWREDPAGNRSAGISAGTLRAALRRVLDEPSFREAAARVQASFAAAGGAEAAAQLIERA